MSKGARTKRDADSEVWLVSSLRKDDRGRKPRAEKAPERASGPSRADSADIREWLPAESAGTSAAAGAPRGGESAGRGRSRRRGKKRELETLRRRNAELERHVAELREQLESGRGSPAPTGKIDANRASFEQLRAIGLTALQSAKLIARREEKAFRSKKEIAALPGLSQAARATIEERLSVRR